MKALLMSFYRVDLVRCLEQDLFIEPGAGNGSFSDNMREIFDHVLCFDIEPEKMYIIK